jgi:hypothetical protein
MSVKYNRSAVINGVERGAAREKWSPHQNYPCKINELNRDLAR